jgi:hypothetical protein
MNRSAQARLLYTLLDAAEDEGRLRDERIVERWHAVKARFDDSRCELEHAALEALIDELDRAGSLTGTWIQARWFAAKARGETSSPFPTRPRPPL